MKRQTNDAKKTFINRRRDDLSVRRPSLRQRITTQILICALLFVSLFGAGALTPPVQAQICGTSAGRIFQRCPLGDPNYEIALENAAIDEMLNVHQLPPTDRSRLMGWQRSELRALIYAELLGMIKKAPSDRTDVEKATIAALAESVKSKRVEAAQFAVDEYNKWKNNSCGYAPPTGFTYPGAALCAGARLNPYATVDPPKYEEFEAYGVARSFSQLTDLSTQRMIDQQIHGFTVLGGIAVGGIAGVAIAQNISKAVVNAILPYALRPFAAVSTGLTAATTATAAAPSAAAGTGAVTASAAAAFGGAVLVVITAVVVGVLRGIDVVNASQIPSKLQSKLDEVRSAAAPDLAQQIKTDGGQQELFAVFNLMTLPDFPANDALPAAQASDPQFRVRQDGASTDTTAATINFKSWNDDAQSARANGGWFINKYTEDNLEKERWTLRIEYINWRGERWTAGRSGADFIHVKMDDPTQTFQSAEIKYLNPSGSKFTASLILPKMDIATLPVAVVRNYQPTTGVPTPKTFSVARVNTDDGQPLNALGVFVNNASSATVGGVTISNLRVDAGGVVSADLAAQCDAANPTTFTLKVTGNGQSRIVRLAVRLSPIDYAFDETGNVLNGSVPNGKVGAAYEGVLSPTRFIQYCGGYLNDFSSAYTFTVTGGQLPPGLSIGQSGGEQVCTIGEDGFTKTCVFADARNSILGTPTVGGTYNFTVKMTFGTGDFFTRDYTIKIDSTPVLMPEGAVSWWSAERGVLDDLGRNNGRTNTGFNVANFAPGIVGQAFSFNGVYNAMSLPDDFFGFAPADNQTFTFETWFKTASSGVIFGRQDTDPFTTQPDNYSPGIYVGNDGKLRAQVFFNGGEKNPVTSEATVNDNTFHHVAVAYDAVEQIVYLDGAEIGRARYQQGGASVSYKYQLGTGYVAGYPSAESASTWFGFRGLIDEPTLYNRALAPEDVKSIYAAGSAGKIFISTTNANPTCVGASNGVVKINVIGGAPPFTYSFDGGATFQESNVSPSGLSAGAVSFTVKDIFGRVLTSSTTLNDPPPISMNPTQFGPFINPGQPYTQNFLATGGTGNKTLTLIGALPAGLTFTNNPANSTAVIKGTPTQSGSFPITVTATDAGSCPFSRNYTLNVNGAPTIQGASAISRQQGTAGTVSTIATVGDDFTNVGNLNVTVSSAPAGVSLSNIANTNGTITANVAAACDAKLGAGVVALKVTDGGGLTATANLTVNVTASTPPTIALKPFAALSSNHKYQTFTVSQMVQTATDDCDGNLAGSVVVEKVTSDEADNAPGDADGNTADDIVIGNDCKSVQLRGERDENRNGRVYTVTLRVTDSSGNTTRAQYKVSVPIGKNGNPAIEDASALAVNSRCL